MTTSLDAIGSRLSQYLSYKRIGINKFGRLTNTVWRANIEYH
jgi:hypothetical protein